MQRKQLQNSWLRTYKTLVHSNTFIRVRKHLTDEFRSTIIYPDKVFKIFYPFRITPKETVKIVFLGHEPYPYPGYSTGLAFANPVDVPRYSPTLRTLRDNVYENYYQENYIDLPLGDPFEYQFDPSLELWANQGVLLLNTNLSVEHYKPNSHAYIWKDFIREMLSGIATYNPNIIFVLLGEEAQRFKGVISNASSIIECEHPVTATMENREWNSNIFIDINNKLKDLNMEEIEWLKRW